MDEAPHLRLQRQASDASQRLHRLTQHPTFTVVIHEAEGQMGIAYGMDGPALGQVEFALFMMLRWLEDELMPAAAVGQRRLLGRLWPRLCSGRRSAARVRARRRRQGSLLMADLDHLAMPHMRPPAGGRESRLETALRHYACACPPNECAMSDDGGPTPVDAGLCGRVAAEALADV